MENNCAFQYYANGEMIEDTGLISKEDGLNLINEYKDSFVKHAIVGYIAEMALWINMRHSEDYRDTYLHIHSDDVIVQDDRVHEVSQVLN